MMIMTTNDALVRHNFISKITLKSDCGELSKSMKVKVMTMRIELGKIRKEFDSDLREFADNIVSDDYKVLANKKDRTEEEEKEFKETTAKVNDEYQAYIQERLNKEVNVENISLTEDEYNEIVGISGGDYIEINENKISQEEYLEALYDLLVVNK